jgi:phytol kinase
MTVSAWTEMMNPEVWWRIAAFGALYAALFGAMELVRVRWRPEGETTRKVAHVLGGCIALLLPVAFESRWPVLLLAAGFTVVLAITARLGQLDSIHGVSRRTVGAILFPAGIAMAFLLAGNELPQYVIAILALTFGDTAAAVVGGTWGRHRFVVWGTVRSIEGSVAALCTCAVIAGSVQASGGEMASVPLVALLVGTVVAAVEAVSPRGTDNLTIPIAALAALWGAASAPLALTMLVGLAAVLAAGMMLGASTRGMAPNRRSVGIGKP